MIGASGKKQGDAHIASLVLRTRYIGPYRCMLPSGCTEHPCSEIERPQGRDESIPTRKRIFYFYEYSTYN